jgi:hypothetical protein
MEDEMMGDRIEKSQEVLNEIYRAGQKITNILKERNNKFSNRPVEQILTEPDLFFYYLFEGFWKLFKTLSENIENPLVQPWVRVTIEQSADIVYYNHLRENEKKDLAIKYFLCSIGFVGGKMGNLDYQKFLDIMDESSGKNNFSKLKEDNYPHEKIHKIWHELFPNINENNLPEFIEKYFLTFKGNSIKKSQLDGFFRDMSLYHHPSIALNNLEKEFAEKSHLFRCFALISISGLSLIRFAEEELVNDQKLNLSEGLNNKIFEMFKQLFMVKANEN